MEVVQLWNDLAAAYLAGDLCRAERLGQDLLRIEPRHVPTLYILSLIAQTSRRACQREYLSRLLEVDPCHIEGLNAMANCLREEGKASEAVAMLRRVLERTPTYADAHNTLGACYIALGKPVEGAKSFKRALDIQPKFQAAQQNLRFALTQIPPDVRATALEPTTAEDFEFQSHYLMSHGKRAEAIRCGERAAALNPCNLRILAQLADAKRRHGDAQGCVDLALRALELAPQHPALYTLLGYGLQDLGKFDEARGQFERSIALRPIQGDAFLGLVTARKVDKEDTALMQKMEAMLEDGNLSPDERMLLHTALSKANDDLGNFQLAVAHIDAANRMALNEVGSALAFDPGSMEQLTDASIQLFTKEFCADNRHGGPASEKPVLIVGLPRSGTSLLEQILSAHPGVEGAGELRFWGDLAKSHEDGVFSLMKDDDAALEAANDYLNLLDGIGPHAHCVIDKMPDNFLYLGFVHWLLPCARFIHTRRLPVDNCVSLYLTPFRDRPPMCYRREDILHYFLVYQRLMNHWLEVIPPDRILEVEYEELCQNREGQARRVLDFLGLEWNDAVLRHEENERTVSTPSNWQIRQKIYQTSIGRWRRYEPWLGALSALVPKGRTDTARA